MPNPLRSMGPSASRTIALLACWAIVVGPSLSQETYHNSRFGYSVTVPQEFIGSRELDTSLGKTFDGVTRDTSLRTWGAALDSGVDFRAEVARQIDRFRAYGWKILEEEHRYGAVSFKAEKEGFLAYLRLISLCDVTRYAAIRFDYPVEIRGEMNVIIGEVKRLFDATGC